MHLRPLHSPAKVRHFLLGILTSLPLLLIILKIFRHEAHRRTNPLSSVGRDREVVPSALHSLIFGGVHACAGGGGRLWQYLATLRARTHIEYPYLFLSLSLLFLLLSLLFSFSLITLTNTHTHIHNLSLPLIARLPPEITIGEYPLDFIPFEHDVLSMENEYIFRDCLVVYTYCFSSRCCRMLTMFCHLYGTYNQ